MNSAYPPPRDRGGQGRRRPVLRRASALAAVALAAVLLPAVATAPAGAQSSATLTVTPSEIERPTSGDKPVTLSFSHSGCSGCWVELDPGWTDPDPQQAVKGKNGDFGAANRWATDKTINGKTGKGAVPASFGVKVRPGNLLPAFIRFTLNDSTGVRAEAKVWLNTPGLVINDQEPQRTDPQQSNQEPEYELNQVTGDSSHKFTNCVWDIPAPTSAVQKVHGVWSPACRSGDPDSGQRFGGNHASHYFVVNTGSTGTLTLVLESCTEARLSLRGGAPKITGRLHSNAFSRYDVWTMNGRVPWSPFTEKRAVAALRHQATTNEDVDRWSPLATGVDYTIEVSALYAGQLGEYTLSYSTSDTGFTATSGRCSTTGESGNLKPPRTRWSCTQAFHQCLHEADPQFWRRANLYGGKQKIGNGDFSGFAAPTGVTGLADEELDG